MTDRARVVLFALAVVCALATSARAQASPQSVVVDRVAVRFFSRATGGPEHPQFITARTLAFEARLQALVDHVGSDPSQPFQQTQLRLAAERHIAETILATLAIDSGTEPRNLPGWIDDMRSALEDRVGGAARLHAAAQAEGISDAEIHAMLVRRVRAAYYLNNAVTKVLRPTVTQLREVYRTGAHPYKNMPFSSVKRKLTAWFVAERLQAAEAAFLQTARSRITIVYVSN